MMETNLYGAQGRVICNDDSSDNGSPEIGDAYFIIEFGICLRAMRVSCNGLARIAHCGIFLMGCWGKKIERDGCGLFIVSGVRGSSALGGSVELGWTRADTTRRFQYKFVLDNFRNLRIGCLRISYHSGIGTRPETSSPWHRGNFSAQP